MTEVEMCAYLIADLNNQGHTIYREVEVGRRIVDVVTTKDMHFQGLGDLHTVSGYECKLRFTLALVYQVMKVYKHFHFMWAVVGKYPGSDAEDLCRELGIGLVTVTAHDQKMKTLVMPTRNGNESVMLHVEQQTTGTPGSPSPTRWTTWQAFCKQVAVVVRQTPGMTTTQLRTAMKAYGFHYRNFSSYAHTRAFQDVDFRKVNNRWRAYPLEF